MRALGKKEALKPDLKRNLLTSQTELLKYLFT